MPNLVIWSDVPCHDIERAKKFYGEVLQIEWMNMPGTDKVAVPSVGQQDDVSFDLAEMPGFEPGDTGARIYFDAKGDIEGMLSRAESAGGVVLQQPQDMGEMVGTIAFVRDTEGNVFGIRQQNA